jgi:hypothetical protein
MTSIARSASSGSVSRRSSSRSVCSLTTSRPSVAAHAGQATPADSSVGLPALDAYVRSRVRVTEAARESAPLTRCGVSRMGEVYVLCYRTARAGRRRADRDLADLAHRTTRGPGECGARALGCTKANGGAECEDAARGAQVRRVASTASRSILMSAGVVRQHPPIHEGAGVEPFVDVGGESRGRPVPAATIRVPHFAGVWIDGDWLFCG